jgi:hypothetical protein
MRINELLVESQQLDEGPFTQAIGKVGGKIAKGVANVGKDLKTGFKAGYSGEQPPAAAATPTQAAPRDPDVPMNPKTGKPLTEPERKAHQDAGGEFDGETGDPLPLGTKATNPDSNPAKKTGGLKGFVDQFKKGFSQGREEPAATTAPAAAPAATTEPAPAAEPKVEPKADAQSKVGVGQINKIIPTLRTRDLMSLKKNLDAVIATKQKAPADASTAAAPVDQTAPAATPPETTAKKGRKTKAVAPTQAEIDADRERNIGMTSDSVIRTGLSLSETLARKVQEQKQRMFETALVNGQHSIFKK